MSKLTSMLKRPLWLIVIGILVVGILVVFVFRGKPAAPKTAVVGRGTVSQVVSVTGTVKPVSDVDLAFERSGRVSRVVAAVGDTVKAGQTLLELNRSELLSQLRQADAQTAIQQANLDALEAGTRPETIAVKQAELNTAIQSLANDYAAVPDAVNDAYAKADDALRSKTNQLFTNEDSGAPRLSFLVDSATVEANAQSSRQQARIELTAWQSELPGFTNAGASSVIDDLLAKTEVHISVIRDSLARALDAVNRAVGVTAATLDTYRTNIGTARTNVGTGQTEVSDARQAIAAQKLVLQRVQKELDLELAGSTPDQIAAQEAAVGQAKANADTIRTQIAKMTLVSPIGGVVTKQDAKLGEIVPLNVTVVRIISGGTFQIEANIPEADIAKVTVGDPASVTLDAYGNTVTFDASVVKIDPGETAIEGVSTYKTTLEFAHEDARIRSGMTANTDIVTEKKDNVIVVPQYAVTTVDGIRTVETLRGGVTATTTVVTGVRGADGMVEVISGLSEGDTILVGQ